MPLYTEEERKRKNELFQKLRQEITERDKAFRDKLNPDQSALLGSYGYSYYNRDVKVSSYEVLLKKSLVDGTIQKPSEYFEKELSWLFDGYIFDRFKPALLYAVDSCARWQYSFGYWRRALRTTDYSMLISMIISKINTFHRDLCFDLDICDVLEMKVTEEQAAYIEQGYGSETGYTADAIAYELDKGNARLENILTDIINGEGKTLLSREIIIGIVKSQNDKMHQLLGKLLIAARLQEGLRQVICESADAGTPEGFKAILKVILENDLIRFSSVKRAVGVWTGLLNPDTDTVDRITGKTLNLISQCLESKEERELCLKSEDCMEIYMALWAYGFYETHDAIDKVKLLSENGTHHQILTAGYFVANLNQPAFAHNVARKVIEDHPKEKDILAVFMPYFIGRGVVTRYGSYSYVHGKDSPSDIKLPDLIDYYSDKEQAERYFDILWGIYQDMPNRDIEFSPCIFPWYSAVLYKTDLIVRLCFTAKLLGDSEKIDKCCSMIKDADTGTRAGLTAFMLHDANSKVQRDTLITALGDKETYTRTIAYKLVKDRKAKDNISSEEYKSMEELLRFKSEDIRGNVLSMLCTQKDEELFETAQRLISDKKAEKRSAGLDIIIRVSKDENRKGLYEKCKPLALSISSPTTKEKLMIDNITGKDKQEQKREALYSDGDVYLPEKPDAGFVKSAVKVFLEYFPDSSLEKELLGNSGKGQLLKSVKTALSGGSNKLKEAIADCKSLSTLIKEHIRDEFTNQYGTHTMDCRPYEFFVEDKDKDNSRILPFMELWEKWYKGLNSPQRLMRAYLLTAANKNLNKFQKAAAPYIERLYGKGWDKSQMLDYTDITGRILTDLMFKYIPANDWTLINAAGELWFLDNVKDEDLLIDESDGTTRYWEKACLTAHHQIALTVNNCFNRSKAQKGDIDWKALFDIDCLVSRKHMAAFIKNNERKSYLHGSYTSAYGDGSSALFGFFSLLSESDYIFAAFKGILTEKQLYQHIFSGTAPNDVNLYNSNVSGFAAALSVLSSAAMAIREEGRQVSKRGRASWRDYRMRSAISGLLCKTPDDDNITPEDRELLQFAEGLYENVIQEVLSVELHRGEVETEYSRSIKSINRIYGVKNFVDILCALGNDTLDRSMYSYGSSSGKKTSLSHLLGVCVPEPEDNAEKLRELVKGTDITEKRLIEAAMFAPEWIEIVSDYLGWDGFISGCYYFMAHMNERFDDKRKAIIAKYTPLSEEELNMGAFDINWFRSAYEILGEKRFNLIYDAAKYISDGNKHSRARKYADATLGKYKAEDTKKTIMDKRNKDLLMAYPLIPLKDENDISERYLYLQQFLKESRQFGSQRSASEKRAVEVAMSNLAMNAGYADVTRLTLSMESKLIDDSRELFSEKEIEGVLVKLSTDESGKTELLCEKDGKKLKSVPAKIKKNEYILKLTDTKKKLTEQYRRTKRMFEQAMEDSTEFTVKELNVLRNNPVALPIIKDLVFMHGNSSGYLDGEELISYDGKARDIKGDEKVIVAHPYNLYKEGHWADYQKNLFDKKTVQPFKQVFRELYVKTPEEAEMGHSLRYAGNQIQPAKTVACLKTRRWVADVEDGLQKVYYKENIVARIYAMADWFSPADIECPTLEWVEFSDRKTGREIKIGDVPDIIFSEVMRDVDLAVSVAHAGGVDPETSHSTIEMRAALLNFSLPLFKISNVEIQGTHAYIHGKLADYTLHLGSGVIHKKGGAMVNILPVHSSQRGKLFLPFADDDPKTAEIITKALFLAEDSKIKDPTILSQIR